MDWALKKDNGQGYETVISKQQYLNNISFADSPLPLDYPVAMRRLYLIAYDITDDKRLNRGRDFLKGYNTGGQKVVRGLDMPTELRQGL